MGGWKTDEANRNLLDLAQWAKAEKALAGVVLTDDASVSEAVRRVEAVNAARAQRGAKGWGPIPA